MKNVNQGLEAFFRQKALFFLIDQIKSQQVRDTQTGLYNYQGFIDTFTPIVENSINKNRSLAIIAIDINNLTKINEDHNRLIGDLAILAVSRFISRHTKEHEVCARLSNDEFLIGMVGIECEKRYEEFVADIPKRGITFHDSDNEEHKVHIHHKMNMIPIKSMPDLDVFINQTVNEKNHQKKLKMQKEFVLSEMTNDELDKVKTVEKILDNDLLSYYFQPIVKVSDGEIFGYEALMRYEDDL
jgi:diguanylate cyclase (GGDEF)-like protein